MPHIQQINSKPLSIVRLCIGIFLGFSACDFLGFPEKVHAQSATLSLSPPVVEILLAPSHEATQTFTLTTEGSPVALIPTLHLAKPIDDEGHVTIDPNPLDESAIPLVITSSLPLGQPSPLSGQPLALTLTFEGASLDVPQDIYLALVLSARATDSPLARQNLGVEGAISSLILVTLTPVGTLPVNLEIEDFSPPLLHDSWTPLSITPTLKNGAPIMVRPEGILEIISPRGNTLHSLPLYPNLILGNSARAVMGSHTRCEGLPHTGCVDAHDPIPLSWSPRWNNLGPHRLRLTITTQGGTKLTEVEKVVWIAPLRLSIILTITVMCLIAWWKKSKKPTIPD